VGVDADEMYDGILVVELPIIEVDVPDPTHLRRSARSPGDVDIDPAAAVEAALDPHGLIARDPQSRTGEAIRVIGYSTTAERVLLVVLLPDDHPPTGRWHLVTSWPAGKRLIAAYKAEE
jgi:hypothetical protein